MAKVKRKLSMVKMNILKQSAYLGLMYGVTILYLFLTLYYKQYKMSLVTLLVIPFLIYFTMKKRKQINILKGGLKGEEKTTELLKLLPKNYKIITNKKIGQGRGVEYDIITISDQGVKIVEVKNYSGTLIGKTNDAMWMQQKNYNGKTESKTVKNPLAQLNKQIKALEPVLYELQFKVPLQGVVYLSHPLYKETYTYEGMIHGETNLLQWLKSGKSLLTRKQMKQIYNLLK